MTTAEIVPRIILVVCIAIPLIYAFHCLLAQRWIKLQWYPLLLMMSTAFLVMSILEASFGYLHANIFGWRLWEYRIYPNHHQYGTYLGFLTWPWYGFHLYCLDQAIGHRQLTHNPLRKGMLSSIDGPLLEILGNGLFLLIFQRYVFYYFPGEFNHLTSIYVMPHYALAGIMLAYIMRAILQAEPHWSLPVNIYALGLCFLMLG